MPVPSSIADISTSAASNYPTGSEALGTSLDDYLRSIQAIIKQESSRGSDITAAASITIPLGGSYFVVTGNTGIGTIADSWQGRTVALKFSGTPVLTHSSGLILPGAANVTMAAGDVLVISNESTGVWRVVAYQPAGGNQAYDADTAKTDVAQTFTAQQTPMKGSLTDASTIDWNGNTHGQSVKLTTAAARTFNAPSNIIEDNLYVLRLTTGGFTPAWNAAYKWATAPSSLESATYVFTFVGGPSNTLLPTGGGYKTGA